MHCKDNGNELNTKAIITTLNANHHQPQPQQREYFSATTPQHTTETATVTPATSGTAAPTTATTIPAAIDTGVIIIDNKKPFYSNNNHNNNHNNNINNNKNTNNNKNQYEKISKNHNNNINNNKNNNQNIINTTITGKDNVTSTATSAATTAAVAASTKTIIFNENEENIISAMPPSTNEIDEKIINSKKNQLNSSDDITSQIINNNNNNNNHHNVNIENIINVTTNGHCYANDRSIDDGESIAIGGQRRHNWRKSLELSDGNSLNAKCDMSSNSSGGHGHRHSRPGSPSVSIRSTTISIASIDENAIDSSIVDSDSEYDGEVDGRRYVIKKLGDQIAYTPDSPDLLNISKGKTLISQNINTAAADSLNDNPMAKVLPASLLNGCGGGGMSRVNGTVGPSSTGPQIGSIALTNSTDVTFGDKHFYEGPVTIQQFLIDSREKWKASDGECGEDNPAYTPDGSPKPFRSDGRPKKTEDPPPHSVILNRKAIIITGTIIILTILIGILLVTTGILPGSKIRKRMEYYGDCVNNGTAVTRNGTVCLIDRGVWKARPYTNTLDLLELPVNRVIIMHTATDTCDTEDACAETIRNIQGYHMDSQRWDDIGYNFLVGSDGRVYDGRGWDYQGAHTKGYNRDSIGVAFIGTFTKIKPNELQLNAVKLLLEEGVRIKKLTADYSLYGARQLSATESPGSELYRILVQWPHWSNKI